jgi:hypothetical protein
MKPAITDIPGIGPAAAASLGEYKITSVARLASASVETISAIPGFSEARATRVIAAAAELLATSGTAPSARVKPGKSGEVEKQESKDKKDKKEKKKKDKGKRKKKDKKKKDKKK